MQNILVVDDNQRARQALVHILHDAFGSPTIHEARTHQQALATLTENDVDLVVMDLDLPDMRGETFIPQIVSIKSHVYIVITSLHDENDRLVGAIKAGARGYLLKEQDRAQLVQDFQGILTGKPPLAPSVTRRLLEFIRSDAVHEPNRKYKLDHEMTAIEQDCVELTKREEEILVCLSKGFSRPEIGKLLKISKHTVATHTDKIYRKLGVTTRSEAAVIAQRRRLL